MEVNANKEIETKLLTGNEAIAWGAIAAGVRVVTAYPGTPSTEVFSTLARQASSFGFHAEWCVNEKAALEIAFGAAITGARSMVTMKQVGLNVASDPLLSGTYLGVKGGLVLVVADDPGPHSSQTEQDTRHFAGFAKVPVLDPADPREAMEMSRAAFALSEKYHLPVILRPTTRVCHAGQDVKLPEINVSPGTSHFEKGRDWVIFPNVATRKHGELVRTLKQISCDLADSPFNFMAGEGKKGIICSGVSYHYVCEALKHLDEKIALLKIGTPHPFPEKLAAQFLQDKEQIMVIEEQDTVLEDEVLRLTGQLQLRIKISGKWDDKVPVAGEFNVDLVESALAQWLNKSSVQPVQVKTPPQLPPRTPILCAGCPHRASFYAIRKAAGRNSQVVFTGDIGCYTLGMMPPLKAVDTCLCMGAAITEAQGIGRAEPGRPTIAVLGDSTFYHTGIPGLINAVYNQFPLTLVILDNSTTAMTGFQPHAGTGELATGKDGVRVDMVGLLKGCGVEWIKVVDPVDLKNSVQDVKDALAFPGPAVVIMQRGCINRPGHKSFGPKMQIMNDICKSCGICVTAIGCPALVGEKDTLPQILDTCTGCGLCREVCPSGAIKEGK